MVVLGLQSLALAHIRKEICEGTPTNIPEALCTEPKATKCKQQLGRPGFHSFLTAHRFSVSSAKLTLTAHSGLEIILEVCSLPVSCGSLVYRPCSAEATVGGLWGWAGLGSGEAMPGSGAAFCFCLSCQVCRVGLLL